MSVLHITQEEARRCAESHDDPFVWVIFGHQEIQAPLCLRY